MHYSTDKHSNSPNNRNTDKVVSDIKDEYRLAAKNILDTELDHPKPVHDRLCKIANLPISTIV